MEVAARKTLSDTLSRIKVSGIAWQGHGFYYSRYNEPAKGKGLSSKNKGHMVFYHKAGTPQPQDDLIYEDQGNPQRFDLAGTTDDERFVFLRRPIKMTSRRE